MAKLTIGGCTIRFGDDLERAAQSAVLPALLMATDTWLKLARVVLPENHRAIEGMQELAQELKQHLREQER